MTSTGIPASFAPGQTSTGANGQRAHPDIIRHTARLERRLHTVAGVRAWCLVGNGLSNQTFIEGPGGLIAIDTGECVEEMRMALAAVRAETDAPLVACIYTHFHYVNGTRALLEDAGVESLPIYGHAGIGANLRRFGGEAGPRYSRGLVYQFGVALPSEGPDAMENVGLGRFLRNPEHAPFTPGYVPANRTFDAETRASIAGLEVVMTPAPSDATDSITIWFPELGLAVNNLVWPALFNVFAIRGEEYRDPRVVLSGIDHLISLNCRHLLGAHGPPLSGVEEIRGVATDYRDAVQYLWDQTVRGANKGLCLDELIEFVQLPERFQRTFYTRQFYGLAEHHVRQIYAGLFGWFDEHEANLLRLPPADRAARLIAGFGGSETVRAQMRQALDAGDFRWALELGSWLVGVVPAEPGGGEPGAPEDGALLARALKGIAYSTPSANLRNWALTRALEREGALDLGRHRRHRLRVAVDDPGASVAALRVLLDPHRAGSAEASLAWEFPGEPPVGLTVRGGVAVPGNGAGATDTLRLSVETWSLLLAGRLRVDQAFESGALEVRGDSARVRRFLSYFDPFA